MAKMLWWRKDEKMEVAIAADKLLTKAAVEGVRNASSRLDAVLDQMRVTNEERRNARHD